MKTRKWRSQKRTKSEIAQNQSPYNSSQAVYKGSIPFARSTPWCIPIPASGTLHRPLSVAEPRSVTRLNTDAGDGVAYLLLSRLTLCLFSTRTLLAACAVPPDGDRSPLVCACAPIANVSVIATMSAVRISASPVFLRLRARSTVNRCADEARREFLRCTSGNFDFVPHERESNSLVKKI